MSILPVFVNLDSSITFAESVVNAPRLMTFEGQPSPQTLDPDARLEFRDGPDRVDFEVAWGPNIQSQVWWSLTILGLKPGDRLDVMDNFKGFGPFIDFTLLGEGEIYTVKDLSFAGLRGVEFKITMDGTGIPGWSDGNISSNTMADSVNAWLSRLRFTTADDTPVTRRVLSLTYTDSEQYTVTQNIVVNITPQNDAPVIKEPASPARLAPQLYAVREGDPLSLTFAISDPEGQSFFTLLSGEDAGTFTWNAATRTLSFAARDAETQSSADGDDDYEVSLVAIDDAGAVRNLALTFRVQDLPETMTLSGLGPLPALAEGTVNAGWVRLDADVAFTSGDAPDQILVSGLLPEDRLGFDLLAGDVSFDGAGTLYHKGQAVATVAGGQGTPLVITFLRNDQAPAAVEAVLEAIAYTNASDAPTATRTLTFDVIDVQGGHANHPAAPSFARLTGASNPFNGLDVGNYSAPALTPLIRPGNVMDPLPDLLTGRDDGLLRVGENLGGGTFSTPSLYASVSGLINGTAIDVGAYSAPAAVDLDGDGRTEIVVGNEDGRLRVFRFDAADRSYTELTGAANPFAAATINYVEQTPDPANPTVAATYGRTGIDVGTHARPTFVDLDRDGLLDLVVGADNGKLVAYRNYGPGYQAESRLLAEGVLIRSGLLPAGAMQFLPFEPDAAFKVTNPFLVLENHAYPSLAGIDVGSYSAPAFSDFDLDGLPDLVVGSSDGSLALYRNTGSGWGSFATNPFAGIDIGRWTTPAFGDIDGDGLDDLVVGNALGTFSVFRNTATPGTQVTLTITPQNDAPVIVSPAAVTYVETRTGPAYRGEATDVDGPGAITWSISGPDFALFTVNASTGEISFKGPPDFEAPLDSNLDNTYLLTLTAKDALNATTNKAITITVTDTPEAPALSGLRPFVLATEGAPPVLLDPTVVFRQGQALNNAVLTVSGLVAGDVVSLQNNALINYNAGAGLLFYNGTLVSGVVTGGNGSTFSIQFVSNASEAAVDAVIQALSFTTTGDSPAATRSLTIDLTQAGGVSFAPPGAGRRWEEVSFTDNPLPFISATGLNSVPQATVLDGNGRTDLLMGTSFGTVLAFTNEADATKLGGIWFKGVPATPLFDGVTLRAGATNSAAARGDVNGDGIADVVVGSSAGLQIFLGQAGGGYAEAPASMLSSAMSAQYAGATPVVRDLDGDAPLEIVLGVGVGPNRFDALDFDGLGFAQRAGVYVSLEYVNTATPPNVNLVATFPSFTASGVPAGAFLDVDGDGAVDIVVGEANGTLRTFKGTPGNGPGLYQSTIATFAELTGSANPFAGIDVGDRARPTAMDVDNDGFMDLVVGAADGVLHWIRSTPALPTITVQVAGTNDAPVAPVGTTVFLPGPQADAAIIITQAQLLQGWTDPEGDTLSVYSLAASKGTLTDLGNGSWRYLGPLRDQSDVSFTYLVSDGQLLRNGAATMDLQILFAGQNKAGSATGETLSGGVGNDTLRGIGGGDTLDGGTGNDLLLGGAQADLLSGGVGADTIKGGGGGDTLLGGEGMDRLDGGGGADVLTGGADADIFTVGFGADRITDFEPGLDRLRVTGFLTYKAVQAAMADTPGGVLLTLAGGTVLLEGVALADLARGDFILA